MVYVPWNFGSSNLACVLFAGKLVGFVKEFLWCWPYDIYIGIMLLLGSRQC
jgi:hypothetical protein